MFFKRCYVASLCLLAAYCIGFVNSSVAQAQQMQVQQGSEVRSDFRPAEQNRGDVDLIWGVRIPLRDGVHLNATVYKPHDQKEPLPVIFVMTPYVADHDHSRAMYFAQNGYVFALVDVRGRGNSEGEFEPHVRDGADGYDAVEWAVSLAWADGNVGTMGQSYLGATQYLLAPSRPPHLKAAFPVSAAADFHQCWVYHTGGVFEFGWQIPYALLMARDSLDRQGLTTELLPVLERDLLPPATPFAQPLSDQAYRRLPLMAWGDLLRPVARYLTDYLRHPEDGPYWWAINGERQHANVNIPMYHVTSWYDIFLRGVLAHFCGLRQHAMTPESRSNQKLIVGPWAHLFPYTGHTSQGTGDIDFGGQARIELHETQLRWFDYWLKGVDTGIVEDAPVKILCDG